MKEHVAQGGTGSKNPCPGNAVPRARRTAGRADGEAAAGERTRAPEGSPAATENHTPSSHRSLPTRGHTGHSISASEANDRVQTVTDSNTSTYEYLLANYGPLLTLQHVAEVMHTTPAGLRVSLSRRRQPMAVQLAATRRRLGRRMYFEARRVADLIDGCADAARDGRDPAARRIPSLGARPLV